MGITKNMTYIPKKAIRVQDQVMTKGKEKKKERKFLHFTKRRAPSNRTQMI